MTAMNIVAADDDVSHNDHNIIVQTLTGVNGQLLTTTKKGADIASAATLTLGTDGNYFQVSGVATISAISTAPAGTLILLEFQGILQLTHNGTSLILTGAANYTTAAGDVFEFISEGLGNWRETNRTTTGATFAAPALTLGTSNSAGVATTAVRTDATILAFDATLPAPDGTAAVGVATTAARRDHVHPLSDPNIYTVSYPAQTGGTPNGQISGGTMNNTTFGGADANSGGTSGNWAQGNSQNLTNAGPTYALLKMARWMVQTTIAVTNVDFTCVVKTTDATTYDAITANHMGFHNVGTAAAGNWFASNANGVTETSTDTTVIATTTGVFLFVMTFDGVTAKYYVNGTLRATHTTNLPTGTAHFQTFGAKTAENVTKRIGVSMMEFTFAAS